MTTQFKTDAVYTLNSLRLICTYIEDNTIWFVEPDPSGVNVSKNNFKLDKKTNKLYKLNKAFIGWDTVENTLSEYGAEQVWESRKSDARVYDYLE